MESTLAGELVKCLSLERRVFPYFKNRYALVLLALAAGRGRLVSDLRTTRFGTLLRKPVVGPLARRETLGAAELEAVWAPDTQYYVVTFDVWAGRRRFRRSAYQITRRGVNLVLQLNFSSSHDRAYSRLVRPDDDFHPFEMPGHPVHRDGRRTLAWVRVDLDLDTEEALIEEVQCDCLREAAAYRDWLEAERRKAGSYDALSLFHGTGRRPESFLRYIDEVLSVHKPLWEEAALTAALDFLVREIGVKDVYFHTSEGGRRLKSIRYAHPPVSLYEKLPRRFCFERVTDVPRFLLAEPGHRYRRRVAQIASRFGFWRFRVDEPAVS